MLMYNHNLINVARKAHFFQNRNRRKEINSLNDLSNKLNIRIVIKNSKVMFSDYLLRFLPNLDMLAIVNNQPEEIIENIKFQKLDEIKHWIDSII